MAMNIFESYGIKQVANVYFEALAEDTDLKIKEGDIVLFLDTLKVSTVETTAENVTANGGWGNPNLISWDYGKEITLNLEDAVISWEEMRILLGAKMYSKSDTVTGHKLMVRKTAEKVFHNGDEINFPQGEGGISDGKPEFPATKPDNYRWIDLTNGKRGNQEDLKTAVTAPAAGKTTRVRFFWQEEAKDEGTANELVISPDTFPGTYRVVGDTLIRSKTTGKDEAFQFVVNKAKMLSEVTLTMQAEGDPSTFNLNLKVLRDEDGNMMSLIKY